MKNGEIYHVPWNMFRFGLSEHGVPFPKKIWHWPVVYHGTPAKFVRAIMTSHLKAKGGKKKALHGSKFGGGVYVSPTWKYSKCYSEPKMVKGEPCYPIFLCRAD